MKIKLPNGLKEDNVLELVGGEFSSSEQKVQNKIDRLNERKKLYMNIENQDDKVYVRLIYSTIQTLIGLYYKDSPTVQFSGRQLGDSQYAKNLSNLQKFDYDEMGLGKKKYFTQWDKFMSGAGIEVFAGWDKVTKTPITKVMKPESRYPDVDYDVNTGFRYHGFELIAGKHELDPKYGFFNTKYVKTKSQMDIQQMLDNEIQKGYSEQQARQIIYEKDHRLLNTLDRQEEGVVSIYQHYTRIDGKPYILTFANERTLLIRAEEIKPVFAEEVKDPNYIEYPVIVRNRSPLAGDPRGVSVPDILEDKQRMIQLFMYLNKVKAENEAWGDVFLYDPNVIENINDLQMPGTGPRFLSANLTQGGTPMMEVPKSGIKSDAFNMPGVLQTQGEQDIGIDSALRGISPESARTATEHQRVQKNANLRMLLGSRIDAWAEKDFWRYRYKLYYKNFNWEDEKNIYLNNGMGQVPYKVKKQDFVTKGDIDVKIISTSEAEEIQDKERVAYMATITPVLQNPGSVYSKNFALRKMYRLNGISDEETYVLVPETPEEIQAKMDLELLNRGEDVGPITNMQEDHMTYIAIYQSALNTQAKFDAIQARMTAVKMAKQLLPQQPQTPEQGQEGSSELDNMQSQLTSNMIQRSNTSQAASLQDVSNA